MKRDDRYWFSNKVYGYGSGMPIAVMGLLILLPVTTIFSANPSPSWATAGLIGTMSTRRRAAIRFIDGLFPSLLGEDAIGVGQVQQDFAVVDL